MPKRDADGAGPPGGSAEFPSTLWSVVLRLGGRGDEGRAALEWLCRAYWYPIYAYIRRRGHPADAASDLTQEFFASILERDGFPRLDAGRGRFRAYLLACCRNFLENQREREAALKRGGGRRPLSFDARDAEGRYGAEPVDLLTPEDCFERRWALSVLEFAAAEVRREYEQKGKLPLFERLRSSLFDEAVAHSHAEVAEELGMTVDAVKKSAQRLRERYREVVRAQVACTVEDPALVQEELRDLLAAVSRTRAPRGTGPR